MPTPPQRTIRGLRRVLGVVALSALSGWVACNDEVLNPLPLELGPGGGGGGTGGAYSGPTINIALSVHDAITTDNFLEGVKICVLDLGVACVTTDAEGKAVAKVPANTALWATLELDNYASTLVGASTGEEDLDLEAPMVGNTLVNLVAGGVNADLDETKGQLALIALGPKNDKGKYTQQGGVTMSLSPPPGSGPYFLGENKFIDPALTATADKAGAGLMFNVEPDQAELTARHPTLPCRDFLAHPKGNDRYDVRVMPGFVTVVSILCGDEGGMGGMGGAGGAGGAGGTGGSGGTGGTGGSGGTGGA